MIEPDINERMARFSPSQVQDDLDPIASEIASRAAIPTSQPTIAMPDVDPVAAQIAEKDTESLDAAVLGARAVNPDEAARAIQVGRKVGIPAEVARADMQRAEQQAYLADLRSKDFLRTDPVMANFLANKEFAEVAHDDVGVLDAIRPIMQDWAMVYWTGATPGMRRGFERGQLVAERGEIGGMAMAGLAQPEDFERASKIRDRMRELVDVGFLGATTEVIAQNLAQIRGIGTFTVGGAALGSVVPVVGTVAGGALGATAGVVATTGQMEAGNLYLDLREEGVEDDVAIPVSVAGGFLNGVIEVVGMKIAAKPFQALAKRFMAEAVAKAVAQPTTRAALAAAGKGYILQVGTEASEEALQEVVIIAGEEIAKAASGIDSETGLRQATERVVDAFVQGAMGSAILGGIGPGANLYVDLSRAANTERQQVFFEKLATAGKDSRLAKRSPEAYERFLEAQAKDGPAETIYVDGRTAQELFAQSGLTAAQLEEVLPGIKAQVDEAVATGGDVTIQTARFGARLANTDLGNALLPHMRLDPDAMSLTEAQEFQARRQEIVKDAERILTEKESASGTFVQEAREIEDTLASQIQATGQMDERASRSSAQFMRDFYVTQAASMGLTPKQVYERFPVRVEGEGMAAPAVAPLAQAARVDTDYTAAVERGDTVTAQRMVDEAAKTWIASTELAGNQIMPTTGTTPGDVRLPLYRFVEGTELRDPQRDIHWTHSRRDVEQMASESAGFIVVAKHPGLDRVLDWESAQDRPLMEREIGAYEYRASVFPEVPIRPGRMEIVSVTQVDADGNRTVLQSADPVTRDDAGNVVPLSRRFDITSPKLFEQAATLDAETQSINEAATAVSDDVAKADSQPEIPQAIDNAAALDEVGRLATGQTWAKGRDLKQAMQNRVLSLAANAGVNLSLDTPQTTEYLTRIGYRDALYALRQNPNSVGWYDEKTRQAIAVMALVHPELLTDENARFAFTWALAVTSNGIKVDKNFELADLVYRTYKATGKMPTDLTAGQAQAAINRSLEMFNELRDAWGIDNLRRFAQTEYTIQELRYIVDDFDAGGEFAETTVKGAGIIGPKIGNGFFSNLYGDFRSLTMDRWLIRTWGRWTGTLIKAMPVQTQNARTRLGQAVGALNEETRTTIASILRDQIPESQELQREVIDALAAGESVDLDVLSTVIQKASMDKDARAALNESMAGQEIRKSGNSLAKYLDGQKEAPAGPGERVQIRAIFASILQELQKLPQYADLTMADLQAALWYAEKRLYETAKEDIQVDEESIEGYADDEAPDYANAASNVARASGVSEQRIQATLAKESNSERSRRARLQDEQGKPVEARDQGPARGFTAKEKRSFNGAAVIRNHRASRGGNAGQPWAYQRSGAKADAKPRLVKKLGARVIAKFNPDRRLRNALASAGGDLRPFSAPSFLELEPGERSAQAFHKLITESKQKNAYGASVYAYPVGDYASMRLFVSEDRQSGFALKPDGDIVSVFSMADSGAGHAIVQMAVSQGGRKLDAFETVLPYLYAPHGFRVVSRLRWDESQKPEGWDKQTFKDFNGGEPDVVFMVYDPTYYGQHSKKDGKVARSYDAAVRTQTSEVEKIAQGGQFQQAMPAGGPRGGFDPRRLTTILNKTADLSTFLHESAHAFLTFYEQVAQMPDAPARIVNDLDEVLRWAGIAGDTPQARLATWNGMTLDQKRKAHEQFAYSFEVYLFEGKAPSAEMQGLFERFSAWLKRVYRSIRDDLNAIYRREFGEDLPILTGEVRQVMDRMLATDEQIARQAAINEMKPMFQTQAESGMSDAEWAAYQQMQQEAIEASVIDMNVASMRQMQWLGNARSRVLREVQKKHDARRKEVAVEIAAEVKVEPVYRAMTYLRTGKFIDAEGNEIDAERDVVSASLMELARSMGGAEVEVQKTHRLDMKKVRAMYAGLPSAEDVEVIRATGMAVPTNVRPDIAKLGTR